MAAPNEDALSQRLLEIEYIRRELEEYITALNSLQITQESINRSLSGLSAVKGESDVFVPYSQDIFFKGKLTEVNEALVGIGSNVFKKFSIDKLKEKLGGDLTEINESINKLAQMIQSLQQEGSRLEQEANRMYEEYRTGLQHG